MAEPALQIPEPISEDPEAVATALETAAIFGAQGDAREALRWLRRAAELASDDGQDVRALTLARTAADLSTRLQASSAPPAQPAPSSMPAAPPAGMPAAPTAGRGGPASGRALRPLPGLERPEPARGGFQEPPPPPPPLPPPHEHFGRPARESYAEATRSGDDSEALTTPRRRMTQPGTGPAFDPRGGLPPFTSALQPVSASAELRHSEPEPELTLPRSELAAPPAADALFPPDEPTPPPEATAEASGGGALFRQTVRVSVAPNPAQPGTFIIELLEESERPSAGSEEALLVLLNPHSALLHESP